MKLNSQMGGLLLSAALPFSVLMVGCDKKDTAADVTVSTDRTNAMSASTNQPDNTGKNVRDRNDATLTPGDQGGTAADRDITQKVRRGVTSGTNDYSMVAKNIKIITTNGKVTLRGPVKTDAEKAGIEAIAKTIAGDGNVDNQLEVKANP
jgi:osmotically-inducible protein OsmY